MTATLMEGRALAERIRAQVADEVRELGHIGLATVQVGDDEASAIYLRLKHKAAAEVGIEAGDEMAAALSALVDHLFGGAEQLIPSR